jgi:hypothetical protein
VINPGGTGIPIKLISAKLAPYHQEDFSSSYCHHGFISKFINSSLNPLVLFILNYLFETDVLYEKTGKPKKT